MKIKFLTVLSLAFVLLLGACGKKDADIQKAAQDKLTADSVAGVTVAVNSGVATLSGQVADITVKNKAEASVKSVDGVKSVNNSITLKPLPVATPAAADPMLQGTISQSLNKAGCTGATVETVNGKVTIKGTVPAAKYGECIQVVNQGGAMGIDNQLQKGK
ncbi:MAG: BON domain-containing protein [Pyrinomonadaceae bacterium]